MEAFEAKSPAMSRAERRAAQRAAANLTERPLPGGLANSFASLLLVRYGDPDSHRTSGARAASEEEALDRLNKLKIGISEGTVNTYEQVGRIVGSLFIDWLDTAGGRTPAIDQSAAKVFIAISQAKAHLWRPGIMEYSIIVLHFLRCGDTIPKKRGELAKGLFKKIGRFIQRPARVSYGGIIVCPGADLSCKWVLGCYPGITARPVVRFSKTA